MFSCGPVQDIVGLGLPNAWQKRLSWFPSVILERPSICMSLTGSVKNGGIIYLISGLVSNEWVDEWIDESVWMNGEISWYMYMGYINGYEWINEWLNLTIEWIDWMDEGMDRWISGWSEANNSGLKYESVINDEGVYWGNGLKYDRVNERLDKTWVFKL